MKTLLNLFLLIFSLCSCAPQIEKAEAVELDDLWIKVDSLQKSMNATIADTHPSYTQKDVAECTAILKTYLQEVKQTDEKEAGMKIVQSTIIKLNQLNDKCDGQLIETDEREKIAYIIISASSKKGYNTLNEDITEQWREW